MDALSDALIKEGVVREEILAEIKNKTKGRSFVLEMFDSINVDEEKVAGIFAGKFRINKADLSDIMPEAVGKFTKEHAMKYMCIPFERDGRRLKVAMLDPLDLNAIQEVSFITGLSAIPHVSSKSEILNAIGMCYEISSDLTNVLEGVSAAIEGGIEFLPDSSEGSITDVFQTGRREDLGEDAALSAPAIKLVNLLIKEAMQYRASDIHIEPGQKTVNVRFRLDGVLKTHTQVPKWIHSAIISRIKIMSRLDISNRKSPQDGSVKLKVGSQLLDLRISVLPTHLGEKVVIRVLVPDEGVKELNDAVQDEDALTKIKRHIVKPQGIVLVTGPTGSGKTTTLRGVIKEVYSEGTNIMTVEDPVEYELEGVTQVQVQEKAGLTFANTLRSILRQDPDVVMIGEIRDLETAEIAFRASMTGHLVLSTLHTTGTASTITRLFDIGVEPYIISSSLQCIVAQRLVRVNCEHCLTEYAPDEGVLLALPGINRKARFMKGAGCEKCHGSGFEGRMAIMEVMEISSPMRKLIAGRTSAGEIKEMARKEGMKSLYEAALEKVYKGVTTPDEVLRVISVEEKLGQACPNCSRTYTEDECPYCGEPTDMACLRCSGLLEVNWGFCPTCGSPTDKKKLPEIPDKPRVLIVDDEFGILKMVELALKPLELDVHTAQNGREALEKAHTINPNLVVTDINMPVMDGFELIKELRSKVNTMFIPIVILSSRDTAEDKLKGFTYGTDDYITKPFDYSELQARVMRLLKRTYG